MRIAPLLAALSIAAAGPALSEGGTDDMEYRIGAHGLSLPTTFSGTVTENAGDVTWTLSLWSDQSFQLKRVFPDGERSDIADWRADPSSGGLILRNGAEMPLSVVVTGGGLQVIDGVTGSPAEGRLVDTGALAPVDLTDVFLGGTMTYMADAALFEHCASGQRFPIAMEGDYLALEQAYSADRAEPGAPLYVMFEGDVAMREQMEGPARQSIVVDRFIRTQAETSCERLRGTAALRNTYWRLDQLGQNDIPKVPGTREPHLVLETGDEGQFRANVGCNLMRGTSRNTEDTLSFSPPAATMMACPPPIDGLERDFITMLNEVAGYSLEGETLLLRDNNGETLAVFSAVYF